MKTQRKTTARWAFELACYLVMLIQGVQLAGYQYSLIYITEEFHLTDTAIGLLSCMQFLPTLVVPLLCMSSCWPEGLGCWYVGRRCSRRS